MRLEDGFSVEVGVAKLFCTISDGFAYVHDLEGGGDPGDLAAVMGGMQTELKKRGFKQVYIQIDFTNAKRGRLTRMYLRRYGFTASHLVMSKDLA